MNYLLVGNNKAPILSLLRKQKRFLLIDAGELIDELSFPKTWDVTFFDATKHTFNPLQKINTTKARALSEIVYTAFPQGENTLTVRNGKRALTKLALKGKRLDKLPRKLPGVKQDDVIEAHAAIDDLLLSPILTRVLTAPINFSPDGVLLAKLDPAELGELDCFILGNLLVNLYKGQVVVSDFELYQTRLYRNLIRQNRLIAGISTFAEVPQFRERLLLFKDKIGSLCTVKDAETLADYSHFARGSVGYADLVRDAIK